MDSMPCVWTGLRFLYFQCICFFFSWWATKPIPRIFWNHVWWEVVAWEQINLMSSDTYWLGHFGQVASCFTPSGCHVLICSVGEQYLPCQILLDMCWLNETLNESINIILLTLYPVLFLELFMESASEIMWKWCLTPNKWQQINIDFENCSVRKWAIARKWICIRQFKNGFKVV